MPISPSRTKRTAPVGAVRRSFALTPASDVERSRAAILANLHGELVLGRSNLFGVAIRTQVDGAVARGFEPVREAFAANFEELGDIGAACCVHLDGHIVVDLW